MLLKRLSNKFCRGWGSSVPFQLVYLWYIFRAFPKGVVHRDIKLENVLLSEVPGKTGSYIAKIADFGISLNSLVVKGEVTTPGVHPCFDDPYYLQAPEELLTCMEEVDYEYTYTDRNFNAVRILCENRNLHILLIFSLW